MSDNLLNNNALAALTKKAAPQVLSAIKQASAKTGVNFAYLVEQAAAESSFNAKAESRHSSATGLYQFIESTWLNMVKKHGHKYGMGDLAAKINDNGKVADKALKQDILDLRKDPQKAALLAAEFAAENKAHLQRHVGGDIGSTELYFAHFMGAGGAAGFLNAMKDNPLQTAADLFPRAARANHNVFYDRKTGEARTLAGVYEFFDKKFGRDGEIDIATPPPPRKPSPSPRPATYQRPVDLNAFIQNAQRENMLLALQGTERKNDWAWPSHMTQKMGQNTGFDKKALLFNPAELMLLAQNNLPTDSTPEKHQ